MENTFSGILDLSLHKPEVNFCLCRRICKQYEAIKETVRSIPENTEELVTLDQFIARTYEETVPELIEEIAEAVHRLSFLLDHASLPGIYHVRFLPLWVSVGFDDSIVSFSVSFLCCV